MSKVRCLGCANYVNKASCLPYGLGWCCDDNCRTEANRRRWAKEIGRIEAERTAEARASEVPRAGKRQPAETTGESPRKRRPVRSFPTKAKRLHVLTRDGHRCRFCRQPANHLHHIFYRSEGGGHSEYNLITLCLACHTRVHGDKRHWKPILLALIWLHYVEGQYLTVPQVERYLRQQGLMDVPRPAGMDDQLGYPGAGEEGEAEGYQLDPPWAGGDGTEGVGEEAQYG